MTSDDNNKSRDQYGKKQERVHHDEHGKRRHCQREREDQSRGRDRQHQLSDCQLATPHEREGPIGANNQSLKGTKKSANIGEMNSKIPGGFAP